MTARADHGFTPFDEPPVETADGHGDVCECADCREMRARQYREQIRYMEFREEAIAAQLAKRGAA